MNARERYLATINFEKLDRPLFWECAYWGATVRRWYREGLPEKQGVPDDLPDGRTVKGNDALDIEEYFGFDPYYEYIEVDAKSLIPAFEEEILEDHGEWVLQRNANGLVEKQRKDRTSIRSQVRTAVTNRDDWEAIKERLRPDLEGRTPENWDDRVEKWKDRDYPLNGLHCEHWLHLVELIGQERLLTLFYDDPDWMKEMLSYLSDYYIPLAEQVLKRVVPENCWLGGDFCYKNGPMMSPACFREFLLPEFRRVATVYRDYGVPSVIVHTDGDFRQLIPLFIEAGVTGVHPYEVTNGQDVVEIRKAYPRLEVFGGIDKRAVAKGKKAIDDELERQVPFMTEHGGYIPYIDHSVPPDISFENFSYYRRRLAELAGGADGGKT